MKLSVDLDGLTWSELIDFVDAARAAGMNGEQLVGQVVDPNDPDERTVGLEVEVPHLDERTVTFDHVVRLQYAQALSAVLETDGDARGVLRELRDLRDGLLQ
jgi:hypothetical protein